MLTLPLGIEAMLDLDAQRLTLCEPWLGSEPLWLPSLHWHIDKEVAWATSLSSVPR